MAIVLVLFVIFLIFSVVVLVDIVNTLYQENERLIEDMKRSGKI